MLMDEDGSENNQVKVATLLVSQLFSCWQNQGVTKDSSLAEVNAGGPAEILRFAVLSHLIGLLWKSS